VITRVELDHFTAFEQLGLPVSPGINVFLGANATGKTHLLKLVYSACDITKKQIGYPEKLVRVFRPSGGRLGRLVHRQMGSAWGKATVEREDARLQVKFSNHATGPASAKVEGLQRWVAEVISCAYLPVKEMLAHAPGFRSLYASRDIHFEEVYSDIIDRAFLPVLRGSPTESRRRLLESLETAIEGKVFARNEEFFLRSSQGNLEFTLLAEGLRKLALLWLLIQNGTLLEGSVLLWDEPETNLNPQVVGNLMDILLELQRGGVQVLLATHDYFVLKELDLRRKPGDRVTFHSLYRDDKGRLLRSSTEDYASIDRNAIADTFGDVYDRDVRRALGKKG